MIRTYLIEKAALEGKVVEEFHESIHGETNIPWRYEYFLEVSLRLQNLKSDENVAVVERIILGKEMPPRSYSGRGYFLYYKELPSIETDDDKAMVAEMARLVEEYMNASRRGAEVRGSDDLAAYKAICELLSLLSVEERKEFQMRVAGFMD